MISFDWISKWFVGSSIISVLNGRSNNLHKASRFLSPRKEHGFSLSHHRPEKGNFPTNHELLVAFLLLRRLLLLPKRFCSVKNFFLILCKIADVDIVSQIPLTRIIFDFSSKNFCQSRFPCPFLSEQGDSASPFHKEIHLIENLLFTVRFS